VTNKPRVIHYYPRFLDHRSGVTESITAWAAIAAQNVGPTEVWVAGRQTGPHRDADRLRDLGIPIRRLPHVGRSGRTYLLKWWTANLAPGDIFYVHEGWVLSNVLAVSYAKRVGATVIAMPHGVYAPQVIEAGRDVLGLRARLEGHALRQVTATHLFFASEAAEVTAVADKPVPSGFFSNPAPAGDSQAAWEGDGDYFVWIGRFATDHKGLDLLLEGWAHLPVPRPRLVLAGPDYLGGRADVQRLAGQLGLEESVSIRGSVSGAEKTDLMVHAKGYIHSSRWDACSMMLLEFMARGTPCLVNSTVHAATDYARAGAALTFESPSDFPDRIAALTDARSMGRRAEEYVREHVSEEALQGPYASWLLDLARAERGVSPRR
jgi:glycosyltransferase involved in cell wall biosynthesis